MALVRPTTTILMALLFVLVLVAAATISFTRLSQNDSVRPNVNENDVVAGQRRSIQRRSLIERTPRYIQMDIEKGMKIDALEREQRFGYPERSWSTTESIYLDIQMDIEKGMKIDALEREQRWGDLELERP